MRRTILGVLLVIGIFSAGATAQEFFFPLFVYGYKVTKLPRSGRVCDGGRITAISGLSDWSGKTVQFVVCDESEVRALEYFAVQTGTLPAPVYLVPSPIDNAPAAPKPVDSICPGNFVHTVDGQGCVPPNHPLAPKR